MGLCLLVVIEVAVAIIVVTDVVFPVSEFS